MTSPSDKPSDVSLQSKKLAALASLEKQRRARILDSMYADSFPKQWAFIHSPARLKSALTSRRAGKSMGDALYLIQVALMYPGCSLLYCGLTDESARRIIWKDCLKVIAKKYGIQVKLYKHENAVYFDNGSILYIVGIDSDSEQMDKIYGQKYKLIIIDEAALYKQDIRKFVYEVAFPAVSDYEGTICLTGMPSSNTKSFFYEVTTGLEPGWENHQWNTLDNPYMAKKWQSQIAFLKKSNPNIEETPSFIMSYYGRWCVDSEAKVYGYKRERNSYDHLPTGRWQHVLAIDLGYDPDPSAFTIVAYREYDPNIYIVESYKRKQMTLSDVAERVRYYQRVYSPYKIIIDNTAKQAVEELKQRFNLPLTAAEQTGKYDFIAILNDDIVAGKVKIRSINCDHLISELETLCWDEKARLKGEKIINKRAQDHCADTLLYAWRYCYNYIDRGAEPKDMLSDEEHVRKFWEREMEVWSENNQNLSELEKQYGFRS